MRDTLISTAVLRERREEERAELARRPHDPIGTHADWYATYPQRLTCAACGKATACIHRVSGRCVPCQKGGAA